MRTDIYEFCLHSTEIFAGNVPFMQFGEYMSGSSVATAIRAGLSFLVISCHYLANGNRPKRGKKWKNDIVKKIRYSRKRWHPTKRPNMSNLMIFARLPKHLPEKPTCSLTTF
ncbi:hypothetical protein ANO14919_125860 [Xylariales sp. No.14919]|nr:hypothetical protein ANO14919_125860 [Xylariales sp. No.14919]